MPVKFHVVLFKKINVYIMQVNWEIIKIHSNFKEHGLFCEISNS